MNTYDVGDSVRCKTNSFVDIDGLPVDPETVVFKVKDSAGIVTSYTYGVDGALIKASTGVYYVDVPVTASGTWSYRFAGTGIGQAAAESQFDVRQSYF